MVRTNTNALTVSGVDTSMSEIPLYITDTRVASFPSIGSFVTEGGAFVKKNLIIGQTLNVQGTANISGNVTIGSSATNQTSVVGSLNVSKGLNVTTSLTCDTLRSENGYFRKRYIYNVSNTPSLNISPQILFNGIMKRTGDGSGTCNDKFPDYSTLVPLLTNATIGLSFSCIYVNISANNDIIHFVPGSGCTIYGPVTLNPGSFVSITTVITSLSESKYDIFIT
jgi:hypothetical protein